MDADEDILQTQKDIVYTVRMTACDANKYLEPFLCYDYIWLEDKHLRLRTFLRECERKWMDDEEIGDDGGGSNAYADNDEVTDPNLQTEMFQNQVRETIHFLLPGQGHRRIGWQRNTSHMLAQTPCTEISVNSHTS